MPGAKGWDYSNKHVLVTGGSRGLGLAIALGFARASATLTVVYKTDNEAAKACKRALDEHGADSAIVRCDVGVSPDVARFAQWVADERGDVDILVNNAGTYDDATVWNMSDEAWTGVLSSSLTGTFHMCRALVPGMRKAGWGRIINVSSVVGQVGVFGAANYAAAKAGLAGFTKSLAKEVISKGITANLLSLGYFDAGMLNRLPSDLQGRILATIPAGRWGKTSEVAAASLFLASDDAAYITGQVLGINGGHYM